MKTSKKDRRKIEVQQRVIETQTDEIERLKAKINELEIEESQRDAIIELADDVRDEMDGIIAELKEQKEKYEDLFSELLEMRNVMEEMVFNGKYKLLKRLFSK